MVLNLAFVYSASFMDLPVVTEQLIIHYKETEEKDGWNLSKAKCVFFSKECLALSKERQVNHLKP